MRPEDVGARANLLVALRGLRFPGRACRIADCRRYANVRCKDRLCPHCGWIWAWRHARRLERDAHAAMVRLHVETPLWVTLKVRAASMTEGRRRFRDVYRRFRAHTQWTILGAVHFHVGAAGGCMVHAHVLIISSMPATTIARAVGSEWLRAGGSPNLVWSQPARSIGATLRYATNGAVEIPRRKGAGVDVIDPARLKEWILATRGMRLVLRARARGTEIVKRISPPSTKRARERADRQRRLRVERRVLTLLRSEPASTSTLVRSFTSSDRAIVRATIAQLQREGRIGYVGGTRRWSVVRRSKANRSL